MPQPPRVIFREERTCTTGPRTWDRHRRDARNGAALPPPRGGRGRRGRAHVSPLERKKRAVAAALKQEREKNSRRGRQSGNRKRSRSSDSDSAVAAAKEQSRALQTACFAFSKGYGPCAKMKAGSKCKQKIPRAHKCHVCDGPHSAKEKGCKPKKKEG